MAIDQACNLLRNGDSNIGIVAGCNILIDPEFSNMLAHMSFLSKDGYSYAFDARANGYARGEGIAAILLQPLSKALAQKSTIRALIRSSAANQDGRTPTITQPNSKSQQQLILDTYQKAGLSMAYTRFFEAHGTGTAVGDPKEASAISTVFRKHRSPESPLYVGALKSNIGHLEGASGIAAVIKTIMILEKGIIVPNYNFQTLNPSIKAVSCLKFPTECVAWPHSPSIIRRASINCFGYGGSNCHIVVDDAYSYLHLRGLSGCHATSADATLKLNRGISNIPSSRDFTVTDGQSSGFPIYKVLNWSAASKEALEETVKNWQAYCSRKLRNSDPSFNIDDLAYTLDTRRSIMSWRSYAIIQATSELESLTSIVTSPTQAPNKAPRLAFIFTGQGAQWFAMGRELFQYRVFQQVFDEAASLFKSFGCSWSPEEELFKSETTSRVNKPEFAQPLCAIVQVGIVDLLREANVYPRVVVGHSMGEITAAYCTGAVSRLAAFKLAYYRGLYFGQVPKRSGMSLGDFLDVQANYTFEEPIWMRFPYDEGTGCTITIKVPHEVSLYVLAKYTRNHQYI